MTSNIFLLYYYWYHYYHYYRYGCCCCCCCCCCRCCYIVIVIIIFFYYCNCYYYILFSAWCHCWPSLTNTKPFPMTLGICCILMSRTLRRILAEPSRHAFWSIFNMPAVSITSSHFIRSLDSVANAPSMIGTTFIFS